MPARTAVIGEGISSGAPFKKIFPVVFPSPARLRATLSLPDWAPPMNAVTCPARSERLTPEKFGPEKSSRRRTSFPASGRSR